MRRPGILTASEGSAIPDLLRVDGRRMVYLELRDWNRRGHCLAYKYTNFVLSSLGHASKVQVQGLGSKRCRMLVESSESTNWFSSDFPLLCFGMYRVKGKEFNLNHTRILSTAQGILLLSGVLELLGDGGGGGGGGGKLCPAAPFLRIALHVQQPVSAPARTQQGASLTCTTQIQIRFCGLYGFYIDWGGFSLPRCFETQNGFWNVALTAHTRTWLTRESSQFCCIVELIQAFPAGAAGWR